MILYTTHTPDYRPTTPSRRSLNTARVIGGNFEKAYDWLYRHLGIRRATWCFAKPGDYHITLGMEMHVYELEVPDKRVIAINSVIWDHVLSDASIYPDYFYDLSDPAFEQCAQEWDAAHPKEAGWAEHLFKPVDFMEYLVPNPVPKAWVRSSAWVCGWEPLTDFENRSFSDLETLQQWLEAALYQCGDRKPYLLIEAEADGWHVRLTEKPVPPETP